MKYETVKFMLETRMKTAKMNGNAAEQSLMTALLAIVEENEILKNQLSQGDD